MSNNNFYDEDEFDDQPEQTQTKNPLRARMKELERENAEMRKQTAEAAEARRELAFLKAGVDLSSPIAKYFVKGYDGEFTPEAIRQAAMEAQLIDAPEQASIPEQETAAWNRTAKVAAGTQTAQPPVDWAQRLAAAQSEAEVMAILAEAQANQ